MKNRLFQISKSGKCKSLALLLTVMASFAFCGSSLAYDYSAGTIFFDNTYTKWDKVSLAMGDNSAGYSYAMTQIKGTNIWYVNHNGYSGADGTYFYQGGYTGACSGTYYCWYNGTTKEYRTQKWQNLTNGKGYYRTGQGNDDVTLGETVIPSWIGKSYVVLNNTWYKCNNGDDTTNPAWNGADIGIYEPGTTIKLEGEIQSYANDNDKSALCADMWYAIYEADASKEFKHITLPAYEAADHNNKHRNANYKESVVLPRKQGRYYFAVYYQFGTGDGDFAGLYDSNNGNNYVANFCIPGFTASDYTFTSKAEYGSTTPISETYSFNSYGWSPAHLYLSGEECFTFTNHNPREDHEVVIEGDRGSVSISFNPAGQKVGIHKATLTLKGTWNNKEYTEEVTIYASVTTDNMVVLVGDDAVVEPGPKATMKGYVKQTGCDETLETYGFYYIKAQGNTCESVTSGSVLEQRGPALVIGQSWSGTVASGLEENTEYLYKPFVRSTASGIEKTSESCGSFTTEGGCVYSVGDTVFYTIDANLEYEDRCELKFKTIEAALADLKSHNDNGSDEYWWDAPTSMLKKHIKFSIAPNKAGYGTPGERLDFSNINKFDDNVDRVPTKQLIICSSNASVRPRLFGMNLANSRNIKLDNINIKRDAVSGEDGIGHSCLLIGFDYATNNLEVGKMKDSKLEIVNCVIEGDAFCCIHGQGIDGLYMENNNLIANCSDVSNNTKNWGASLKLMNSKNVVMKRNNFKGAHSNNIFAQNVRNVLVMNNVFWNDNQLFETGEGDNRSAVIRLLNYEAQDDAHKIQNIGIYYNTLYLADGTNNEKEDFLIFGGTKQGQNAQWYDASSIEFKYNNCYCYADAGITKGRSSDPFIGLTVNASTNNFWDMQTEGKEPKSSLFSFGTDVKVVNMSLDGGVVCKTSPNTPEGMVIKGSMANFGSRITADASGLGAEKDNNDRLHLGVRPNTENTWTLGAYQYIDPSQRETVHKIIWNGSTSNEWDNRNNWVKMDGSLVTCVDILAEDLEVVIPSPNSKSYPMPSSGKIETYPSVPVWSAVSNGEEVRTNLTSGQYFANNINIEYGGCLLGVENLYAGGTPHYKGAVTSLVAGRSEWILVGSVVKPFVNGKDGETRLVVSNDYFLNHEPHVYMQHIQQEGNNVVLGTPFTSLEETVGLQSAYMIRIPDQYGYYKTPASYYYKRTNPNPAKLGDGTVSKQFDFVGKFSADAGLPNYVDLTGDGATFNFVNNYYPANLDILQVLNDNDGFSAKYYDYEKKSWRPVVEEGTYIKPQNGYVLISTEATSLQTEASHYVAGNTAYLKSAGATDMIKLALSNTVDGTGSVIYIKNEGVNSNKAFGLNESTPELYVAANSNMYDVFVPEVNMTRIPLGIKNNSTGKYSVRFAIEKLQGFEEIILEDVLDNKTYDLTLQDVVIAGLNVGTTEGRFFLNIGDSEEITTGDDPVDGESSEISIVAMEDGTVVISAPFSENLKGAEITSMGGITKSIRLKDAHYNRIKIDGVQGAYVIKAIGETQSKTVKMIVK